MSISGILFQSILVLLNGTVIDGTGSPPRSDAVVEIRDGRLTAVGSADDYEVPEGADVVDVTGKWVLPGLIDTHTHFLDSGSLYTSPDDYDLTAFVPHADERRRIRDAMPATLDAYLCSGVTTVASLGGPRWELDVARETRAPHVLTTGPFLANFPVSDVTLWTLEDPVLVTLESPEDARAKVRELEARGVDLIKVGFGAGPGLTLDDFEPKLEALVDEAHRVGLRVAMHAEELDTAKMAVRAGVDVLAHTVVDRVVDEEFLELASESGVVSITGLAHLDRYRAVLEGNVELLPIESRCGDARVIATWDDLEEIPAGERPEMPPAIRWGSSDEARRILETNVRKLHAAGIPIATGSNGGNVGTLQGPSYHRELHRLAAAGIPLDAIVVAATRDAARALGIEDVRGTLTPGKLADVLVLRENPLESVEHFAAIDSVFVDGRRVERRERVPAEPMSYLGARWLERESRFEEERPDLVLEAMELEPGDVVADVGTGTGFYARQIAPEVQPGGRVYAVDIQQEMLELLRQLVEQDGVDGVIPVLSEPDDPGLPAGELDWILLADVYHEIAEPEPVLAHLREALAPGGRVLLLEYRVEDGTADHIKADHAMSVRQVLTEWKPAGFELVDFHELLPTQHLFVFGAGDERGMEDYDLLDALAAGIVQAEIVGGVTIRLRRDVDRPIMVTLPAGTAFEPRNDRSEMIARRDAAIFLEEDRWYEWKVRALRRERGKRPPGEDDVVEIRRPPPSLRPLLGAIQAGTHRLEGRVIYPPRTLEVERAAVWIADQDLRFRDMEADIEGDRLPASYAAAFALMLCDAAGIDVTRRRIWRDAARLFDRVHDPTLERWYELERNGSSDPSALSPGSPREEFRRVDGPGDVDRVAAVGRRESASPGEEGRAVGERDPELGQLAEKDPAFDGARQPIASVLGTPVADAHDLRSDRDQRFRGAVVVRDADLVAAR